MLSPFFGQYGEIMKRLNDLSLAKKFRYLYCICVLFPVVLTDAVILRGLVREERMETSRRAESIASAVEYNVKRALESSDTLARSLYINDFVQDFLNTRYADAEEYVSAYQAFRRGSLLQSVMGLNNDKITFYADNDTIINGGGFQRLSDAEGEAWYRRFSGSSRDALMTFFYDGETRRILYLRSLNRSPSDTVTKLLAIETDYGSLARTLTMMNYDVPVYVCLGDEVLFSNAGANRAGEPFERFAPEGAIEKRLDFTLYGADLRICVLRGGGGALSALRSRAPELLALALVNFLLPLAVMNVIARSVTERIRRLSRVFDKADNAELIPIADEGGGDEIGGLMRHYNRMTERMNGLIETVFKARLREREMDIKRKDAELLALYSQINPHFLFNALEAVRMRSVLKNERETARMIEALAALEREKIDWSSDMNSVKKEVRFARAYLDFQKYRFGERLSYDLTVQEGCEDYLIPKLTVTTFVENACVHGIGGKRTPGWVFVRVYAEAGLLRIEVEDTGKGMDKARLAELSARMGGASLDMLKEKGGIGIVNVCLRIRMVTDDSARFSVESEEGVGTEISISFPLEKMERGDSPC